MTQFQKLKNLYYAYRPFSHQDYVIEAEKVITLRHELNYYGLTSSEYDRRGSKSYSAKWSVISRKRKAGLLISVVYYLTVKHDLDLTAAVGKKLLQGLFNATISSEHLVKAFADPSRTSAEKSPDMGRLDAIIKSEKAWALMKLGQNKARILANKDLSFINVVEKFKNHV